MRNVYRQKPAIIILLTVLLSGSSSGADSTRVTAARTTEPIVIDGHLSEAAWNNAVPASTFIQRDPVEYGTPSEQTVVKVLFDNQSLYIGAILYDSAPDSIMAMLARHDYWTVSDEFLVYLDPYFDRRSGYYFGLNAAGTRFDGIFYNDTWSSDTWDGVWEGAAVINEHGWCAEFRIPYSQLRFHKRERHIWGINFKRGIRRKNEWDYLVFKPKNGNGFVSRFWELDGITGITQPYYFEIMPYVRGKDSFESHEAEDPFHDGSEFNTAAGTDLKMGLGSNLTLNATINPDFGQVEVDPAVVNLSDVETFYSEKRPFFTEGSSFFEFGYGGATDYWGFNWSTPNFFYSRRIGGSPRGSLPDYDYCDSPDGVHILSAVKLSGKFSGNWNVGSLQAVTMREYADIEYEGEQSHLEVEPATYYTVTRGQKEINNGRQGIGAIATTTHRFFDEDRLREDINSDAFGFGLDGWTFLDKEKTYVISAWSGLSHIQGSEERITSVQESSLHYFQRPDASHVELDSSATSLTGAAGRILLNKEKGNVFLNTAVGLLSPKFDVNDVGYLSRSDKINAHFGTGYQWTEPTSWTRYAYLLGCAFSNYDFGGNLTWGGLWTGTYLEFHNYYNAEISAATNPETVNPTRTRGGPRTLNKPGWEINFSLNSDNRKPFEFGCGSNGYTIASDDWSRMIWLRTEWKPAANLSFEIQPELMWNKEWLQWVDSFEDETAAHTYNTRYVFAEMYQTELSATIRMNWTFTPKIGLQFFAQPLLSSGDYSNFKELSRPNSTEYRTYPADYICYADETYTIDPDGDGPAEAFEFDEPDFNFRSLRGNIILRWEYRPGSILYLVWTHDRSDEEYRGRFKFNRSIDRLFSTDSDNIFLIKASYWMSI